MLMLTKVLNGEIFVGHPATNHLLVITSCKKFLIQTYRLQLALNFLCSGVHVFT